MKTEQKSFPAPPVNKPKGRYNSIEEALEAKRNRAMLVLKGVDLKKLTS